MLDHYACSKPLSPAPKVHEPETLINNRREQDSTAAGALHLCVHTHKQLHLVEER